MRPRLVVTALLTALAAVACADSRPSQAPRTAACPMPLRDGARVPGWRMGAIQFLTAWVGVGLTAAQVPCRATQLRFVSAPVWLAVTRDGGSTWRIAGRPVPIPSAPGVTVERIVAASTRAALVVAGDGEALGTSNAGTTWSVLPLPRPVVQLTRAGGDVWALSCPQQSDSLCHPVLERARAGGSWVRPALAGHAVMTYYSRLALTARSALVYVARYPSGRGELLYSRDGVRFVAEAAPRWDGQPCTIPGGLVADRSRVWLLCIGGAAAGSSTKGLLRSDDGGRTWRTVSAVTSILRSPPPGSLNRQEPNCLAAGSHSRLWVAWQNGFSVTNDGGATWSDVQAINAQGLPCSFAVLSPMRAWLLVPGGALWRTVDGADWRVVGRLGPGL